MLLLLLLPGWKGQIKLKLLDSNDKLTLITAQQRQDVVLQIILLLLV